MTKKKYINIFLGFIGLLVSSCANINSNAMFKIPKGEDFKYDSLPLNPNDDYKLGPGDRFSFIFGSNQGERIVFNQSGISELTEVSSMTRNQNRVDYLVRQNGEAELPLVGKLYVKGLTLVQLEDSITKILSKNFIDPYVQIRITNQRVMIFPGKGQAQVVYLSNTNTSLLEVIALAGGIPDEGKARSIRVMRRANGRREIYHVDLSTIKGLKEAEMVVQGNDYIYIDYKPRFASSIFREVGPWLTLLTTSLAVISIFKN